MDNRLISSRRHAQLPRLAVVCGICVTGANLLLAQEALNESAQVDQGRRARKDAIDRNLYNLKAGPVLMRFDALMGFEFNDNAHLEEDPQEVDFAFRPQLDIAALWALNPRNSLSLNLGIGYVKYVNNTDLDQLIIAPSTEISLDIYTGDFTINVHERVSQTQNPLNDPTVSGTGDFGGIENTVGTRVDWDLNQLTFTVGYDHYNFISTGSGVGRTLSAGAGTGGTTNNLDDVQDRSAELFYGRAALKVSPDLTTGLETGLGLTDYENDFFRDNLQFSVGPFLEAQLSRDVSGRLAGGYVQTQFDETGRADSDDAVDDFYAEVSLEHQLNQFVTHRLALGREARSGASSELVTLWYARYQNDWRLSQYATLNSKWFYEKGRERSGQSERLWRTGLGAGLTVPLSRQINATGGYQLLYKDSNQAGRDYWQNVVSLEFRYAF